MIKPLNIITTYNTYIYIYIYAYINTSFFGSKFNTSILGIMNSFSMDDFSMWHNHQQDTMSLKSD